MRVLEIRVRKEFGGMEVLKGIYSGRDSCNSGGNWECFFFFF